MRLEALDLWLDLPETGPLLPQLQRALADRLTASAEPLRWAITAAQSCEGGGRRLRLEAVVLHSED